MPTPEAPVPFFVAGGTVPPGSPSYVERAADRELLDVLLSGEFCHVLNSRQMGKSSLAVRTIGRLQGAGVRTAFVDLTRIGGATVTPEQWYAGLLLETGRALGLRSEAAAWLKAHRDVGPAQRLLSFLHEEALSQPPLQVALLGEGAGGEAAQGWGPPVVLMLDEIDAVRSLPFSTDELFAGLRQLHNGRASDPTLLRLTVCLLGAALPSDLVRDPRTTPFNVGRRIELRDFTPAEAAPFAAVVGEAALARVLHWTGGHPFLTQAICAGLASPSPPGPLSKTSHLERGSFEVDALVRARYLDARARETDTNLADVGNRLLGNGDPSVTDEGRAATLSLYERLLKGKPVADDEANPAASRIKMSGVARTEDGNLKVRNRIYASAFGARWIREAMPGGELRRQRRAFYRGVLRTALVSAAVLAVVSTLAAVAVRNADRAHRAELEANRQKRLAQGQAAEAKDQRDVATRARDAAKTAQRAESRSAASLRVALAKQRLLSERATLAARIVNEQRTLASRNALEAGRQADSARRNAKEANTQRGRAEAQTHLVLAGRRSLEDQLYENRIETLPYLWQSADAAGIAAIADAAKERKDKGWEWGYWNRVTAPLREARPSAKPSPTGFTRHDRLIALPGGNRVVRSNFLSAELVDGRTGRTIRRLWSLPALKASDTSFYRSSFSANGRWAVRDDENHRLVLHDIERGTFRPLPTTDEGLFDPSVSDDGSRYLTYTVKNANGAVGRITVWDVASGRPLYVRTPPEPLLGPRGIAPDGRTALFSYRAEPQGRLGLAEYDFARDEVATVYALPITPRPIGSTAVTPVFGPDDAVVIRIDRKVAVFRRGDPKPRFEIDTMDSGGVAMSFDGKYLLLSAPEGFSMGGAPRMGNSQIWDLRTRKSIGTLSAGGVFSSDGRRLLSSLQGVLTSVDWRRNLPFEEVSLLDALPRPRMDLLMGASAPGDQLSFDSEGTVVAERLRYAFDRSRRSRSDTHLLSIARLDFAGRIVARYPAQGEVPEDQEAVPFGEYIIVRKGDTLNVLRIKDFRRIRTLRIPGAETPEFDFNARHAASIDSSGVVSLWNEGPTPTMTVATGLKEGEVHISGNGDAMLVWTPSRLKVWGLRPVRLRASIPLNGAIMAEWEDEGRSIRVMKGGINSVYDVASGRKRSLESMNQGSGQTYWAESPDGRLGVAGDGNTIEIHSKRSGRRLFTLEQDAAAPGERPVADVRFSRDGHTLYVLLQSGKLRIYRDDK